MNLLKIKDLKSNKSATLVGTSRCDVPARSEAQGGTNVVGRTIVCLRSIPSPDAALGDGDGAARHPYLCFNI
jgi:hypothetical protein